MDTAESRRIDRVTLACVQCRGRHVKCDATQPTCTRCQRDGKECTYQKSRRGGLDKAALAARRRKLQRQADQELDRPQKTNDPVIVIGTRSSTGSSSISDYHDHSAMTEFQALSIMNSSMDPANSVSFVITVDRLLEIYYDNFWSALPITLPLPFLNARRANANHNLDLLLLVMQFVGSVFAPWTPIEPYYETAYQAICQPNIPRDGFSVQALMIFAIAQYHQDHRREARVVLDLAIEIALELGINTKEFAQIYGEGNPVLEESWRRTYYLLQIADQHFAVTVNNPIFVMRDVENFVDLPCEDEHFESGQIPPPKTWAEYQLREFEEEEFVYSSITYLYDVSQIVAYIMKRFTVTGAFTESLMNDIDTKAAAWLAMMPAVKTDPLRPDGTVDEIMFLAHMCNAVLLSALHRPGSSLVYSMEELTAESFVSPVPFMDASRTGRSAHTARALKAAEIQTKLLSIPCAAEKHHLFTLCISATLGATQIAACGILDGRALSIARDRVRLSIGFLAQQGTLWPLAKKMAKELRTIARCSVFVANQKLETAEQDPSAIIEIPRDDLIWPIDPSAQIDIYSGIVLPMDLDLSLTGDPTSSSSSTIS